MSEPLESCGLAILLTQLIMASQRKPDAGDMSMRALHPLHSSRNPPKSPAVSCLPNGQTNETILKFRIFNPKTCSGNVFLLYDSYCKALVWVVSNLVPFKTKHLSGY